MGFFVLEGSQNRLSFVNYLILIIKIIINIKCFLILGASVCVWGASFVK